MQSDFSFRAMSLEFRLRDFFRPPERILREAGIRDGLTVLDFGCGPGGFSQAAAKLVGPEGRVYAVDNHPLNKEPLLSMITGGGLFLLAGSNRRTFQFKKNETSKAVS
jgi:23S rRNA U2552 (ribose-2'-O)-methylase RlmE/FtsJ